MTGGPLSFGQLSIWRDVRGLPDQRRADANVSAVWPLPGGAAPAAVRRALDVLVKRHPSLRTTYRLDDPDRPEQVVHADAERDVTVSESPGPDLRPVLAELTAAPFDLSTGTGWRARILTRGQLASHLVLVNHHIVADGGGQAVLQTDLAALLRSVEVGPDRPYDLITMAEQQRAPSFAARRDAAIRNWLTCLPPACGPGIESFLPVADSGPLQASLRCAAMSGTAYDLARRHDLSASSVFLAAYALAISRTTGMPSIPLRLMSSNRFSARWGRHVTSMNQWAPLHFDMPAGIDLPALAQQLHNIALRTYRLGMYDPEALARVRTEQPELAREAESAWAFNHIAVDRSLHGDPGGDEDTDVRWEAGFHRFGHRFYLRVFDDGTLRLRARDVKPDFVAAILHEIRDVLRR